MEEILFSDLLQSLKEANDIAEGKSEASSRFEMTPPDVQSVRERVGLSQDEFASMMRVSVRTLQNWEKHRGNPSGPAAALLKIVVAAPEVALKSLRS